MKILILSLSIVVLSTPAASQRIGYYRILQMFEGNVKAIDSLFANLQPIQRLTLFGELGVKFDQLTSGSLTNKESFRKTVLESFLTEESPIHNFQEYISLGLGDTKAELSEIDKLKLMDTYDTAEHIASHYLPSVYNLSAEDVFSSLEDYKPFLFLDKIKIYLVKMFGRIDGRELIDNLNRLDHETIDDLVHKVAALWSLRIQEKTAEEKGLMGLLLARHEKKILQDDVMEKVLNNLDDPNYPSSYGNEVKERAQEWSKIKAMAPSPERNKAISELFAKYIFHDYKHDLITLDFIRERTSNMGKLGIALLDDLSVHTIYAANRLGIIANAPLHDQITFRLTGEEIEWLVNNFFNILDKEMQKLLPDKEQH